MGGVLIDEDEARAGLRHDVIIVKLGAGLAQGIIRIRNIGR